MDFSRSLVLRDPLVTCTRRGMALSSKKTSRVEIPFLGVIDTSSLRVEASVYVDSW